MSDPLDDVLNQQAERDGLEWLTSTLNLDGDPITNITRFGRHEDARLVITLRSGTRITFDRQADLFEPKVLTRRVVLATGVQLRLFTRANALVIATAIVRAADATADDDDRDEADEWANTFLSAAMRNGQFVDDLDSPAGKWEALSLFDNWHSPVVLSPFAPIAERSLVVIERGEERYGRRWVRLVDVAAHVRGAGPISWATLKSRMKEIGWRYRCAEQWCPADRRRGRLKVKVFEVPTGWGES